MVLVTIVSCNMYDGERKRDKAHEEISKGLKVLGVSSSRELGGVPSEGRGRRWDAVVRWTH